MAVYAALGTSLGFVNSIGFSLRVAQALHRQFSLLFCPLPSREYIDFLYLQVQLKKIHHSLSSLIASFNLFRAALSGVLRSPTSFFDTTPMGILFLHFLCEYRG